MLASGSLRARYIKDFMDCSLRGFIATVETSMLMFPVPHSLLVHNGTKHITNINRRINEFLMGFWQSNATTKSHFVIRFSLKVHRPRKIQSLRENEHIVCLFGPSSN